jgi:hypothetical protein
MPEHPEFKLDPANDGRPAWKKKNAQEVNPEAEAAGK